MKWLHFILSHSIFIAVCAVAMCFQTVTLLPVYADKWLYGFVFFATIFSYNAYWLLSKKIFGSVFYQPIFFKKEWLKIVLLAIYATGVLICYWQSQLTFTLIWPALVLNVLYVIPLLPVKSLAFTRRLGFLKTILLALSWAYVTAFLPLLKPAVLLAHTEIALLINRFLFMLVLCVLFDSRDISVDKVRGLHSIATDLKPRLLQFLIIILFILLAASTYLLQYFGMDLLQVAALQLAGLATLYLYYLSNKKRGYFFYYFFVDGLMLFSAAATYVASI
jgi:4-hydroxybenzoate polyprenyltransferase